MQSSRVRFLKTFAWILPSVFTMYACMQVQQPTPKQHSSADSSTAAGAGGTDGSGGSSDEETTGDTGGSESTEGSGGASGGASSMGGSGGAKPSDAGLVGRGGATVVTEAGPTGIGGSGRKDGGTVGAGGAIADAGRGGGPGTGGGGGGDPPAGSCKPEHTFSFPLEAGAPGPSLNLPQTAVCIAVFGSFQGWGCTGTTGRVITVNGEAVAGCTMDKLPARLSDGYRYFQVGPLVSDATVYYAGSLNWY